MSYKVIRANMLSRKTATYSQADSLANIRSFIRHDEDELSKILMMILEIGDYENIIKEMI